jgi:hypothetical protein
MLTHVPVVQFVQKNAQPMQLLVVAKVHILLLMINVSVVEHVSTFANSTPYLSLKKSEK